MKKSILIPALIALYLLPAIPSRSQDPAWLWAVSAESNGSDSQEAGMAVTTDASGNSYVTGYFTCSTLTFGSFILTRTGTGNVFLVKYDAAGNVLWATASTGAGYDVAYAIATDPWGNVVVAGTFSSPVITFGAVSLALAGLDDAFIVKYDPSGNVLWAQGAGETHRDNAFAIASDGAGDIYLAGAFRSTSITFGSITIPNPSSGYYDAFLVKYGPAGNVLWAKGAGGPGDNRAMSLSADQSGNVCLAGTFGGLYMTFDVGVSVTNKGLDDLFLAKYDGSGNVLWAKSVGGANYDQANSVAMDGAGNAYLAGEFSSVSVTFGSITLMNIAGGYPSMDICLAKYDASGNVIWAAGAGGPQNDAASSVTADAEGYVYATGYFYSDTAVFGSVRLVNTDYDADLFVTKYGPDGGVTWALGTGGTDDDKGNAITRDADGYLYLTGSFGSPFITFGSDTLENTGGTDFFLAKLDDNITGTREITGSKAVAIFPNPAADLITVSTSPVNNGGTITVYNLRGELLLNHTVTGSSNQVDVSSLTTGVYFVKLSSTHMVRFGKFVKE